VQTLQNGITVIGIPSALSGGGGFFGARFASRTESVMHLLGQPAGKVKIAVSNLTEAT